MVSTTRQPDSGLDPLPPQEARPGPEIPGDGIKEDVARAKLAENDATLDPNSSVGEGDDSDSLSVASTPQGPVSTCSSGQQAPITPTASTSPLLHPTVNIGLHTWALMRSTRSTTSACGAVYSCLASSAIVLFQCIVLVAIIEESSFPACETHEECREGQYCHIRGAEGCEAESPFPDGICSDCSSAASDCGYCNQTDMFPEQCDYLQIYHRGVRLSTIFVLIFTFFFIVQQVLKDMDQNSKETDTAVRRLQNIGQGKETRGCRSFYIWFLYYYRAYMLPGATVVASAALMISEQLTSQNILLTGVAMTIVGHLDDAVVYLFIPANVKYEIWHELNQDCHIRSPSTGDIKIEQVDWALHRVYCAVLTIFALVITLLTEAVIRIAPPSFAPKTSGQDYVSCDDITDGLFMPFYVALVFSGVDKIFRQAHWKVIVRDFFCGPLAVFFFAAFAIGLGGILHEWNPNFQL